MLSIFGCVKTRISGNCRAVHTPKGFELKTAPVSILAKWLARAERCEVSIFIGVHVAQLSTVWFIPQLGPNVLVVNKIDPIYHV